MHVRNGHVKSQTARRREPASREAWASPGGAAVRPIPQDHVDDLPVWSVWCIRVRPGHRGRGISHALLDGAVEYARSQGAPAVEGYPVDNQGAKVDTTMAYVGTRGLFERAGFVEAAATDAVSGGFPRVLMRLTLHRGTARGTIE